MKILILFLSLPLISCSTGGHPALTGTNLSSENVWPKFQRPFEGPSISIGKYGSGCLSGGAELKPFSGLNILSAKRNRHYGHPSLHELIDNVNDYYKPELLIGDMSQPRGGPMPGGHSSHQTGLDVDIYYSKSTEDKHNSMVSEDGKTLKEEKWQIKYEELLKFVATKERVDRIFVNAAVKKILCEKYPSFSHLNKIRPWYFHDSHFHVRMKCPELSTTCVVQEEVDTDPGCGKTLAWWFTEEALEAWNNRADEPVEREYDLPLACKELVN